MAAIEWQREMEFTYGRLQPVAPGLRRMVCPNPSAFTLHGTGTYVVGHGRVAIVDPGPDIPEHVESLLAELRGERVAAILVTHTHCDHSPAARRLATRTGARTYGFGPHGLGQPQGTHFDGGADLDFNPEVRLGHGDAVAAGGARLIAFHTPGHCHNHLCFRIPEADVVLTGDHVMGWSTSVVMPPDGHMGDYIQSLRALRHLPERRLVPAHGPPIEQPQAFLEALIEHRMKREAQVLSCLRAGITGIPEMVAHIYQGLAPALQQAAACSVLAHALYLRERERVACIGPPSIETTWYLV